jgi:hypothetical protein
MRFLLRTLVAPQPVGRDMGSQHQPEEGKPRPCTRLRRTLEIRDCGFPPSRLAPIGPALRCCVGQASGANLSCRIRAMRATRTE